jgi:hypothetical protein
MSMNEMMEKENEIKVEILEGLKRGNHLCQER